MSSESDKPQTQPEPQRGADGWVDSRPFAEPEQAAPDIDPDAPEEQPIARRESWGQTRREPAPGPVETPVQRGKPMAVLSHMSVLFGVPVFMIPLIQRDNAFALHHAKAAMVTYLMFIAGFVASFLTCGLAVPLALLLYVPAIVGVVHAARGDEAGPWAFGRLGERMLDLQVKPDDSATSHPRRDPNEETGQGRQDR